MHNSERMDDRRKAIIWREWKKGSPMSLIARALEKPPATVVSYLLYHGGIQPRARCRRSIALSIEEREEISRGFANNQSIRSIARSGLMATIITIVACCVSYYFVIFRYSAPTAPADIDQMAERTSLHARTGLILPSDARFISATVGAQRQKVKRFYYWSVYVPGKLSIPCELPQWRRFVDKHSMVEFVEDDFRPWRISNPESYSYHRCGNGDVTVRVSSVTGEKGTYLSVSATIEK